MATRGRTGFGPAISGLGGMLATGATLVGVALATGIRAGASIGIVFGAGLLAPIANAAESGSTKPGPAPQSRPAVVIPAAPAASPTAGPSAEQRRAAQSEAGELRERIQNLRRDLNKAESDRGEARDALRESEAAISDANRRLRDLTEQQRATEASVAAAATERAGVEREIGASRERLARLARAEYATGRVSPWQMLLSGENPNTTGRNLALLGYVGRAQLKAIAELEAAERRLADLVESQHQRAAELAQIREQQEAEHATLEREKQARGAALDRVSARLDEQRKQVGAMERDAMRLDGLIDKLGKIIADEERKERERIAAEKRRAEQAAREAAKEAAREAAQAAQLARETARREAEREALRKRAEAEAQAAARARAAGHPLPPGTVAAETSGASGASSGTSGATSRAAPVAVPATPATPSAAASPPAAPPPAPAPASASIARPAPAPAPSIAMLPDGSAFEGLRGRLALPAQGDIAGRFGKPRDGGQSIWKGLFIAAPSGSEVHAVANGRVVFADWLRGFGNIVIVDHGGQYLSIYAGNESMFKTAGQSVSAGDTIASVGSTGGAERPGLYFELRHAGTPFDPSGWLR